MIEVQFYEGIEVRPDWHAGHMPTWRENAAGIAKSHGSFASTRSRHACARRGSVSRRG